MESEPKETPGLRDAVRRLGATLLASVQTRMELFAVEWTEERQKFLATLVWTVAALFSGMLAIVMVTLTVVAVCPQASQPWVLGAFAFIYMAAAAWTAVVLRRRIRQSTPPFSATVGELKKDAESLRSQL